MGEFWNCNTEWKQITDVYNKDDVIFKQLKDNTYDNSHNLW